MILTLLIMAYGGMALFAYLKADSLMFPCPPPSYETIPGSFPLPLPSGGIITARYWPCTSGPTPYTLIYSPGNAQDLGKVVNYAKQFASKGFNVLGYEYPGCGHTPGTPTEALIYEAAEAAYSYVNQTLGVADSAIVLYGFSLGGGPSVELAIHHPVAGLILEGTFASAFRVMTHWKMLPWDCFDNLAKISQVKCPILIIHGLEDTTVPPYHSEWLIKAATAPLVTLFVPGAHHSNAGHIDPIGYDKALVEFRQLMHNKD